MGLTDEVRANAAAIAEEARFVRIDLDRVGAIEPGPPPALDPERHYLEGSREDVAAYLLTLDAINFGSGWFPTLQKRPGCSGYYTISWALADHYRAHGPWSNDELRRIDADVVADVLGQERGHELMGLYAQALRQLGDWLGDAAPLAAIEAAAAAVSPVWRGVTPPPVWRGVTPSPAGTSAEALAERLREMPFFDDTGFWKRAQITANDFQLAGIVEFA